MFRGPAITNDLHAARSSLAVSKVRRSDLVRLCKHRFQQGNFEAVCVVSAVRPAMRRFDLTTDSLFAMSEPQLSSVMDPPSTIKKDLRHFAKVWCCACVITAAIQLSVLVVGAALTG